MPRHPLLLITQMNRISRLVPALWYWHQRANGKGSDVSSSSHTCPSCYRKVKPSVLLLAGIRNATRPIKFAPKPFGIEKSRGQQVNPGFTRNMAKKKQSMWVTYSCWSTDSDSVHFLLLNIWFWLQHLATNFGSSC